MFSLFRQYCPFAWHNCAYEICLLNWHVCSSVHWFTSCHPASHQPFIHMSACLYSFLFVCRFFFLVCVCDDCKVDAASGDFQHPPLVNGIKAVGMWGIWSFFRIFCWNVLLSSVAFLCCYEYEYYPFVYACLATATVDSSDSLKACDNLNKSNNLQKKIA